jgi:hypothetical protein
MPLPPNAELQWWYQFYFATERGRAGYDKYRREFSKWPTATEALDPGTPYDAQSVTANLASSGTTRGELPFVPRTASIALELAAKVIVIGWVGFKSRSTSCQITDRGLYDFPDLTTRQGISANSLGVASRRPIQNRPSDSQSAQGPCRRLPAAS